MQQTGLNSDVNVGKRLLHVQTSFSKSASTIVSNIFENGRVVDAREIDIPRDQVNGRLENAIKALHNEMVAEIELLFYMAEKVKHVRHANSCNKLGLVFLRKGFFEEAIVFFNIAISTDSEFADAYKNLGTCYLETEDFEQAEKFLHLALEKNNDFADIVFLFGRLFFKKQDYGKALESFEKCAAMNPSYFAAHFYISLTLLQTLQNQYNLGEPHPPESRVKIIQKHLDHACQAHKPFVNNLSMQARSALVAGKYHEAIEFLLLAYEQTQPEFDLTFDHEFYLKFMYGGKGKDNSFISGYIERLNSELDKRPEYADLHNNLGIAYLIMCRNLFLKALEEFRAALKINPKYKRAEKNLKLAENDGKGFLILLRALLK